MGAGPRGTSAERLARHRSEQWRGHARYGVAQQAGQGAVVVPTPPSISLDPVASDSQNHLGEQVLVHCEQQQKSASCLA